MAEKDKAVSHREKLDWARKHLETLDESIDAFLKSDAYNATEQYDAKERNYVARIRVTKDLLPDWGLMAGDIIHNLRSSLDSLAYALSVAHSGVPTDEEARSIQFLLCDEEGEFRDPKRRRYIKRLSPTAQAEMERLQPFKTKLPGFKHQLSVLRDLSNIDKHRHILLTRGAAETSSVVITGPEVPPGTEIQGFQGPFEDGTVIARWSFDRPLKSEVKVHVKMAVVIEFADGPAQGGSLVPFLALSHDVIRDHIFPNLEPLLA